MRRLGWAGEGRSSPSYHPDPHSDNSLSFGSASARPCCRFPRSGCLESRLTSRVPLRTPKSCCRGCPPPRGLAAPRGSRRRVSWERRERGGGPDKLPISPYLPLPTSPLQPRNITHPSVEISGGRSSGRCLLLGRGGRFCPKCWVMGRRCCRRSERLIGAGTLKEPPLCRMGSPS